MEQQTWESYVQQEDNYNSAEESEESEESEVESSEESEESEVERVRYRRRRSLTPPRTRSFTNGANETCMCRDSGNNSDGLLRDVLFEFYLKIES